MCQFLKWFGPEVVACMRVCVCVCVCVCMLCGVCVCVVCVSVLSVCVCCVCVVLCVYNIDMCMEGKRVEEE